MVIIISNPSSNLEEAVCISLLSTNALGKGLNLFVHHLAMSK